MAKQKKTTPAPTPSTPGQPAAPKMKLEKSVLETRHPEVAKILEKWKRVNVLVEEMEECYADPAYFIALPNENAANTEKRKQSYIMGFRNPSQELISIKGDYILRRGVDRKTNSPELLKFINRADRSGQSLNDFMRNQAGPTLQAYGTVFGVVDKPQGVPVNRAEELDWGMPYLCILHPMQVMDWQRGPDGKLEWFLYFQGAPDTGRQPGTAPSTPATEFVLWTKTEYLRFDQDGNEIARILHGFGVVPVAVQAAFTMDNTKTLGKTTFLASSRHIFMANNLLSQANFEIEKDGSVLMVDRMDWNGDNKTLPKDATTNLPKMTKAAHENDVMPVADISRAPKYLTKDTEAVSKANEQAQWYFSLVAEAEFTGQEPVPMEGPQGNPQSGVSKAYDFQDADASLSARAGDMQAFEIQILTIVSTILQLGKESFSCKYPNSFDVRGFQDKVNRVLALQKIKYPSETGMRAALRSITTDLSTDDKEQQKINGEIEAADLEPKPAIPFPPGFPGAPPQPGGKPPADPKDKKEGAEAEDEGDEKTSSRAAA